MGLSSGETDYQLIHSALNGNEKAINQLISRYYQKITLQIRVQVHDAAAVNDLVQDVCIKLFRHIRQFDCRSNFTTWLYRIIQNTVKNYYRSRQLMAEREAATDYLPSDAVTNPEALLIEFQLGKRLDALFSQLPLGMQQCFLLHVFGGLSYDEVAAYLNCPLGTVRSRICRTREMLWTGINKPNDKRKH
ncbi:sigma-70 family RNA polymerase sigma factor [Legionella sp. MW5194]|uniref:RNA polymerase sigma factor n=1 Tax=Legionella sp. MW5194 TaxID=2662448 RepID=UPI00193D3926|nr:sigma-70 family RNA polymerase sigma factor [Legionella sp. MW5194]QRN03945.1 sigma-70 family RNA polymerase sigma factor [Legionella sp. MW5194]